ncbi:hypothetical protein DPMN_166412 [Dreissena polymorpha]|uniref:Uncharacterized protein n=1 Tax=Dreissena polymorpha TaxID=45954 RepID=A0A9D4EXX3_DREPO|nr:hypothetical protein DPMN_166412 [Dreissena polymorpha]
MYVSEKDRFKLCGTETQAKYEKVKSDESTSMEGVYSLDDDRIITTCFDNVVRVFDVKTGSAVTELETNTLRNTIL